jgi:hypothetical protein
MALTTFTGPVRSLNGFLNSVQNSTTGEYTNNFVINSAGTIVTSPAVSLQQISSGTLSATTGDSITTLTQPANTVITKISVVVTDAPTVATGDIGFEVGTSSSGGQIVATAADEILDGGTTVPAGALYATTLINSTVASDAAPATSGLYTATDRTIYFNITNTTTPSARGTLKWIFEYSQVA